MNSGAATQPPPLEASTFRGESSVVTLVRRVTLLVPEPEASHVTATAVSIAAARTILKTPGRVEGCSAWRVAMDENGTTAPDLRNYRVKHKA